jgi:hypothetical protein
MLTERSKKYGRHYLRETELITFDLIVYTECKNTREATRQC